MGLLVMLVVAGMIYFFLRSAQRTGVNAHLAQSFEPTRVRSNPRLRRPRPATPSTPQPSFESDSCELCGARPQVRYVNPTVGSVFEFCGHHGRRHRAGLLENGFQEATPP